MYRSAQEQEYVLDCRKGHRRRVAQVRRTARSVVLALTAIGKDPLAVGLPPFEGELLGLLAA